MDVSLLVRLSSGFSGGKLSEETTAWMKMQLEEAKKQGVTVIPVSHHNLLDESTLYPEECTIENTKEGWESW